MKNLLLLTMILTTVSCSKEKRIENKIQRKGCKEVDNQNITLGKVIDGHSLVVSIPNIITPNGDGINDNLNIIDGSVHPHNWNWSRLLITQKKDTISFSLGDAWYPDFSSSKPEEGIFDYKFEGNIDGIFFEYVGEVTIIIDETELKHCETCFTLDENDPLIKCK